MSTYPGAEYTSTQAKNLERNRKRRENWIGELHRYLAAHANVPFTFGEVSAQFTDKIPMDKAVRHLSRHFPNRALGSFPKIRANYLEYTLRKYPIAFDPPVKRGKEPQPTTSVSVKARPCSQCGKPYVAYLEIMTCSRRCRSLSQGERQEEANGGNEGVGDYLVEAPGAVSPGEMARDDQTGAADQGGNLDPGSYGGGSAAADRGFRDRSGKCGYKTGDGDEVSAGNESEGNKASDDKRADASAGGNVDDTSGEPFGDPFDDERRKREAAEEETRWHAELPTVEEAQSKATSIYAPAKLRALARLRETNLEEFTDLVGRLVAAASNVGVTRGKLTEAVQEFARHEKRKDRDNREQGGGDEAANEKSQAKHLLGLATDVVHGHTSEGNEYARCPVSAHFETYAIDGSGFRKWLRSRYYRETKRAPREEALKEACSTIAARALFDAPEVQICVRVGEHAGAAWYLDLGTPDWSAVEITPTGWKVVQNSPVWFVRSKGSQSLPIPEPGGSIDELRPFLNTRDEDAFRLSVGHAVVSLRPRGPFSNLAFTGPPGAGKTTGQRVHRRLVDPNIAESRALPKDTRDLMVGARLTWEQSYDNTSRISEEINDAWCRMLTGGAFVTRGLYTNSDEQIFHGMRPTTVTSVMDIITRPDLVSRTWFVACDEITGDQRKTEEKFWAEFALAQPRILGALLTAVAYGMGQPEPDVAELPRLADAAAWVARCEAALGWDPGTFLATCERNTKSAANIVLDSDHVAGAVRDLAAGLPRQPDGSKQWTGLTTELLKLLRKEVGDVEYRAKRMPQAPNALSGRLRLAAPALAKAGIVISQRHVEKGGEITITVAPPTAGETDYKDTHSENSPKEPQKRSSGPSGSSGPAENRGFATDDPAKSGSSGSSATPEPGHPADDPDGVGFERSSAGNPQKSATADDHDDHDGVFSSSLGDGSVCGDAGAPEPSVPGEPTPRVRRRL
jgi:hypothetical protein